MHVDTAAQRNERRRRGFPSATTMHIDTAALRLECPHRGLGSATKMQIDTDERDA